jgi:hypothetical protein
MIRLILQTSKVGNHRELVQRLHWRFGLARHSRIVRVYFHKSRVSPLTERSGTSTLSQYKSIPDDEIALLARKFCALHKFRKERRRSPRGCFECDDSTHFIADCPKRKKLDSSNKYDYTKRNDYNNGDDKKKYHFGDKKKKKKFQKMMSRACVILSNLDFSSDESSSSKEDEKVKRKPGDFSGLRDTSPTPV